MRLRCSIIGSVALMIYAAACDETEPVPSGQALIVAGATMPETDACASKAFVESCIADGGFDTTCNDGAPLCCFETDKGDALCVDDAELVAPGQTFSGIELGSASRVVTNPNPGPTCWVDCHTEWLCKGPISGPTCMTVPVNVCYTRCILL